MTDRLAKHLPFYAYSRRNKPGYKPNRAVFLRREQALTLYWQQKPIDEIAEELDIAPRTVRSYITRAKAKGDKRVTGFRPRTRHLLSSQIRRRQIVELFDAGVSRREIAKMLDVCERLVDMRLKEARDAT